MGAVICPLSIGRGSPCPTRGTTCSARGRRPWTPPAWSSPPRPWPRPARSSPGRRTSGARPRPPIPPTSTSAASSTGPTARGPAAGGYCARSTRPRPRRGPSPSPTSGGSSRISAPTP
nr:MAG TPA: hypothetical protein [Caudoviricetes sp.]